MQQIKLKRGLDLPIDGAAQRVLGSIMRPAVFQVVPDHFAGVKPKMLVHAGDVVKAGDPLFCDKAFPEMLFTAPVSGTILDIVRGDRRKVLSIDIEADAELKYEVFSTEYKCAEDVKSLLLKSGLWTLIKQRPYDCIALPGKTPKAVFISSFDSAPLAPDYEWVLAGEPLQAAVDALAQLAPVYVGVRTGAAAAAFRSLKNCTLYEVDGPHPAGNVGVQINHIAPMGKNDTVFTVNIQDLALIGRLFLKGIVDMRKKVALTGPMVVEPKYYSVLPGMPLERIFRSNVYGGQPLRYVAGNVLSGHQVTPEEIVSPYDNQYSVIEEGSDTHEFMGWLLPRFSRFSAGKTDPAQVLNCLTRRKEYNWDSRLLGGRRAIIMSGEYDKVFPMDIYPEYLLKAMIAGNLDKMIELGANEVAPEDFALCEYVCTSKMPLQAIVRAALDNLRKEIE